MAQRIVRDGEANGWECSDFPIICESCLGDDPYVRLEREDFDKECNICTRPFTAFTWLPDRVSRFKITEICMTCCKLKNLCQVCLLDLDYEHDQKRKARAGLDYESPFGNMRPNDTILKLLRRANPDNPAVCTFYIKGECTRGRECPYRHEMPENIKDRYYGENDPDARTLEPPEDESIKTLYVGGLDSSVLCKDLEDQFYPYGEIDSIGISGPKACAFVTFTTREAAEKATQELSNRLVVNGQRLKLTWARTQVPKHIFSRL